MAKNNLTHNLFVKNWGIKLICLLAASVLWIYVTTSQNSIAKFPGSIPIKVFNARSSLVPVFDIKAVDIKVMTESSNWKKLSADSFSAYIDLSGYSEGTYEVPVNVVSSISGVQIVQKTPDKILVSLEPVLTKEVVIERKIEGKAGEGLVAGSVIFSPEFVSIRGAKSLIESIDGVVATITLAGETQNFTKKVPLGFTDARFSDQGIEIDPSEAEATVSIIKGTDAKTVGIRANLMGNVKANYYLANITVTPSIIEITGSMSQTTDIKYIQTAPVDVTDLSAGLSQDVSLQLPDGISIVGSTSAKVHLQVDILPVETTRDFTVSNFKIANSADYVVLIFAPAEVKIKCSGANALLNSLKSSDFKINFDLTGKTRNDNKEILYSLSPTNIDAPVGVVVNEILPQNITIQTQ